MITFLILSPFIVGAAALIGHGVQYAFDPTYREERKEKNKRKQYW